MKLHELFKLNQGAPIPNINVYVEQTVTNEYGERMYHEPKLEIWDPTDPCSHWVISAGVIVS